MTPRRNEMSFVRRNPADGSQIRARPSLAGWFLSRTDDVKIAQVPPVQRALTLGASFVLGLTAIFFLTLWPDAPDKNAEMRFYIACLVVASRNCP